MDKLVPEAGDLTGFIEQFGVFANAPDGVENLRKLILQLAISGKLVFQNTTDEPANKLFEKILHQKEQLVKEKKIRNTKKLPSVEGEGVPYSVPVGWKWVRLIDLAILENGDRSKNYPNKSLLVESGIPFVNAGHLQNGRIDQSKMTFITEERFNLLRGGKFKNGDILYCLRGSLGKSALVEGFVEGSIASSLVIIRLLSSLNKYYFLNYFDSSLSLTMIKKYDNGTAQPNLSASDLGKFLVPLPPLEEQKRIVAKVDELMALCDKLEAQQQQQANNVLRANTAAINALLNPEPQQTAKSQITSATVSVSEPKASFEQNWHRIAQHFNTLYGCTLPMPDGEGRKKKYLVGLENVKGFRNVILQLAIRGKLVPQVTTEESAVKLLEKLDAENKGSNKKGKRSIVTGDVIHHPFELPNGWAWAKFPQLGEWGRGKSKHRPRNDPSLFKNGKWPLIQTGDVAKAQGKLVNYSKSYSAFGLEQSKLWPKGTLCITIAANIADSAILGIDACFPDSVVGLVPYSDFGNARYFEYFIRTAKENLTDFAPSTAQKNINLGILEQVNIPLPPLDEQKRIVAKVDQLMTLCDQLEQQLNQSYSDAEKLMQATVNALIT